MKNVIQISFLLLFSVQLLAQTPKGKADKTYDAKGYGAYLEMKEGEDISKMDPEFQKIGDRPTTPGSGRENLTTKKKIRTRESHGQKKDGRPARPASKELRN